jgi:hypothetical protein
MISTAGSILDFREMMPLRAGDELADWVVGAIVDCFVSMVVEGEERERERGVYIRTRRARSVEMEISNPQPFQARTKP